MSIATGRVALVTGASAGIGEAAARALLGAVIAKVIVAAATDPRPKLRYTAGSGAARVSMLRRLVPARIFDKQIRKINRMTTKETRR